MRGKTRMIGMDLTAGPLLRTLLCFSIPIVLSNVIQQVYSLVDLVIVGKFVGTAGTVGVSTGGEISDYMTPLATAFSMSGQILIAQLTGAGRKRLAQIYTGTLLGVMLIVSVLAMTAAVLLHDGILTLLRCPADAWGDARTYLCITAIGIPFIFGYNGICGVLRGMGESKWPLLFVSVAAVLNIGLDVLLVAGLRMGSAGAAAATVVSQFGAFLAAAYFLIHNRKAMGICLSPAVFRPNRRAAKEILLLAAPQIVRNSLVRFSMMWVNANVNAYGMIASSTNSIGNKIQKFVEVFVNGVESAAASMVGQNLGAEKPERAGQAVLSTLGFSMTVAACAALLFLAVPRQLYALFTADPEVIEFGAVYLRIMIMTIFMHGFTGSLQAMVTGSGNVKLVFLLGIVDGVISRIGFSLLFLRALGLGPVSFFWGTAFSRTITGAIVLCYFLSGRWKRRRIRADAF